MQVEKINFEETHQFNPIFLDYIKGEKKLRQFFGNLPQPDSFTDQIKLKKTGTEKRELLIRALERQYKGHDQNDPVVRNIEKLESPNTFTITTGHQLNLFTGPLYFHFKIIATIKACEQLSSQFKGYNFVPVYWMASEDHDFEEINHFHLNGNTHRWDTQQFGAVGRFETSDMVEFLKSLPINELEIANGYESFPTLAGATRCLVNQIYGKYGLVILDGDDSDLKTSFKDIIKDELLNQPVQKAVVEDTAMLEELGYKAQINPREINLFYLNENGRNRIVKENGNFKILNTNISFTETEILEELNKNPDRFSPNALLRPVYQEFILPNLAMVGGPAEVAYWLQLKSVFENFEITFPILLPRSFAIILNRPILRKFSKANLKPDDIFKDLEVIKSAIIKEISDGSLDLSDKRELIEKLFSDIINQAANVDKSLEPMVNAEKKKTLNTLDKIEGKLIKAEKRKHEDSFNQVEAIKNFCFPAGKLQERYSNYLSFYFDNPEIIDDIMKAVDPFDLRFNILMDND